MEKAKSKTFEDLLVWQKAHSFVLLVYQLTRTYPREELYGLVSQYRRAAVSVAANIAEGYRKKGKLDKLRYFNIAQGSLEECRYFSILSKDLEYVTVEQNAQLLSVLENTSRLLNSYCHAILTDISDV